MDIPPCTPNHIVCSDIIDKLRIPHIIGMILAGLAIGEHGFNILARDSSFQLFGKVGLYYIMFSGWSGNEHGRLQGDAKQSVSVGITGFYRPHRDWIRGKCILSEIRRNHFCTASQYVCLPHTRCLSHRHPLRYITPS